MNVLLFHPDQFQQRYNCDFYDVDMIPAKERKHILLGVGLFTFYLAVTFLYTLCLLSMLLSGHSSRPSYMLMIYLAIFHIGGLQVSGLMTAVFAISGNVFCDYPTIIYIGGGIGLATWCSSTLTGIILTLNRCCEIYSPKVADFFFGGPKIFIWLAMPTSYFFFFFWFTNPPVFSGILMSWFFNPHMSYFEDKANVYHNNYHTINNLSDCVLGTLVSLLFVALYLKRTRAVRNQLSTTDKKMCLQVFLIESMQILASSLYVVQQVSKVDFYITLIASSAYFMSQGFPPIVYLAFNRTITRVLFGKILHVQHYTPSYSHQQITTQLKGVNCVTPPQMFPQNNYTQP
ncbi:unnamed protein product [Bursaphelenchus xylophilus]|uniref:(pine wood nematode) hypothetical protein n=1 Tax=Bursaphelenchus xylophilus TaxID=6326 RepID=A0A1I7RIY5_BURXY|nr:unnamed protein product [Bursaphelenchus xylophilus]CAG9119176.1 unnamed protein product [Bursaphelenchus xylophilus]